MVILAHSAIATAYVTFPADGKDTSSDTDGVMVVRTHLSDKESVMSEDEWILDGVNSFVGGRRPLGTGFLAEQRRPRILIVGTCQR